MAIHRSLRWLALFGIVALASGYAAGQEADMADTINRAALSEVPAQLLPAPRQSGALQWAGTEPLRPKRSPAIVRLQILLDRAGASPGVIDGYDGDNIRKAVAAFEAMQGLPADGIIDQDLLARFAAQEDVIGQYTITQDDAAAIVAPLPRDYAELALREVLGFTRMTEEMGERFHMDERFLVALNPQAQFAAGETIAIAITGQDRAGQVVRIDADKDRRQLRAYGADGVLIAAYPATIGSQDNPSPSGVHTVDAVAPNPTYTYNPKINFQQGDNAEVLTLPPGPNGPVGSVWIDLSEPTFGMHGTPEPSLIDKVGSHGCIRLTNWDAEELSRMVAPGTTVTFLPL
jgi:lipoprotein-anchoring transpeptidase ErfK/SrfK